MAVCGSYFITTYIQTKRKRKKEKEKERQCYDQYLMFAMWLHHGLHVLGLFLYDAMIGYTIAISVSTSCSRCCFLHVLFMFYDLFAMYM